MSPPRLILSVRPSRSWMTLTVTVAVSLALLLAANADGVSADSSSSSSASSWSSSSTGGSNVTSNATIADLVQSTVWGNCKRFSVFGSAGVAFDGASTAVATGDVGCSPAPSTAITGAYNLGTGSLEGHTVAADLCAADMTGVFGFLHGMTCPAENHLPTPILNGVTLLPGVYCSSYMELSASTITLDGNNQTNPPAQWVFQTDTTFHASTATHIILLNGALACNVYWAIGTAATIDVGAINFVGQIIAGAAINIGTSVPVTGRLIAGTAVTFEGTGDMRLPTDCDSNSNNSTGSSSSSTGSNTQTSSSSSSSSTGASTQTSSSSTADAPQSSSSSSSSTGSASSSSGSFGGASSSTGLSAAPAALNARSVWTVSAVLAALVAAIAL